MFTRGEGIHLGGASIILLDELQWWCFTNLGLPVYKPAFMEYIGYIRYNGIYMEYNGIYKIYKSMCRWCSHLRTSIKPLFFGRTKSCRRHFGGFCSLSEWQHCVAPARCRRDRPLHGSNVQRKNSTQKQQVLGKNLFSICNRLWTHINAYLHNIIIYIIYICIYIYISHWNHILWRWRWFP